MFEASRLGKSSLHRFPEASKNFFRSGGGLKKFFIFHFCF
nr:MAG TPA: hypothetical protein [Caudoviricetes sp.]